MKPKNVLFLRVPKTASSSVVDKKICNLLDPVGGFRTVECAQEYFSKEHMDKITWFWTRSYLNVIERSDKWFDFKKNNIFTFGFVRNPWDRAVSSWKYGSHKKSVNWNMNFLDYCRKLKTLELYPKNGIAKNGLLLHSCEQHSFLICEQKNLKADFIGKFENLQNDFDVMCNITGIPQQQLPHKNATKHKHYSEYYDDETRSIVAEKYAKDIEYFNYKFVD